MLCRVISPEASGRFSRAEAQSGDIFTGKIGIHE